MQPRQPVVQVRAQEGYRPIPLSRYRTNQPDGPGQAAKSTTPLFMLERQGQLRDLHEWAEAFCLLEYRTMDGSQIEHVWNSRDGIAPYTIKSRLGTDLFRIRRDQDIYTPNYRPQPGQRIIVDYTREAAERDAWRLARKQWPEASRHYRTIAELVLVHMQDWMPGAPLLVIVSIHAGDGSHQDEEEDGDGPTMPTAKVMQRVP